MCSRLLLMTLVAAMCCLASACSAVSPRGDESAGRDAAVEAAADSGWSDDVAVQAPAMGEGRPEAVEDRGATLAGATTMGLADSEEAGASASGIRVDAEPYVRDPRGERGGVKIDGVSDAEGAAGSSARPAARAPRLLSPVAVFRVVGVDLVALEGSERAVLATGLGAQALLMPSVVGIQTTRGMTERARTEGAKSVAIIRFVGGGDERRARVILLDASGGGIGVLFDLEPSLAVVAAAIRECLP